MKYILALIIIASCASAQIPNKDEVRSIGGELKKWNGKAWVTMSVSQSLTIADTASKVVGLPRLISNYQTKDSTVTKLIAGSNVTVQRMSGSGAWKISASGEGGGGSIDTTNRWAPKGSYQATIANLADTAKYIEASDTTNLFAAKFGGWTEIQTTSDTTLNAANVTFVNLGVLQFTMTASAAYEIIGRIFYKRATAANGVTLALNVGGSPTDLGFIFSAADNATDGTDMVKTARITTATDSLQLVNTTVTTRDFIDFAGALTCDGSNRLFGFRWHLEVASSGVTIVRGSYLRYRRIY